MESQRLQLLVVEGRADGIVYGKFQPDLPAATESVLQPEMEFAAEIPPEEEISFIDEIKGVYRNVAAMDSRSTCIKPAMCYAYIYAKQNRLERIGVADDLLQSGYGRNSVFPGNFRLWTH